jgi:hypothetical protein
LPAADSVTFANPQHDFAKRIGYQRAGDALTAWIDGGDASKGRQEFPMKRGQRPCCSSSRQSAVAGVGRGR